MKMSMTLIYRARRIYAPFVQILTTRPQRYHHSLNTCPTTPSSHSPSLLFAPPQNEDMSIPEEEWTGKGLLMKADTIADTFKSEVHAEVLKHTRPLKLVGILATRSGPSKSYAEFTGRQCAALGVEFVLKKVGSAAREEGDVEGEGEGDGDGVEEAIIEANEDEGVDGVMVCPFSFCIVGVLIGFVSLLPRCIIRFSEDGK